MIEITAKQLYDIYRQLSNAHNEVFSSAVIKNKGRANKIVWTKDERTNEWKPTTDLIIKA